MPTPRSAPAEFAERYRAIDSRDARFDGQFYTAVATTGIYCRPSCPARTPKPANVTFYLTSAAAHEAGYRACKRCLPEASPGTPQWNLRRDLAARAMRLLSDGVVDREGVEGLAARLGYTSRHVHRLLVAELGAGPQALARARRAQTARSLLVGTGLRITDVAFASGFGSVRQFNDTVRAVFDVAPGDLRTGRRPSGTDGVRLEVVLPVRHPFDARGTFAFLAARAVAGIETFDLSEPTRLRHARTMTLPAGPGAVELTATALGPGRWELRADLELTSLSDVATAVARVRRLLDADADPVAVDAALAADDALAASVHAAPGTRIPGTVDPHELLVRALVGRRTSLRTARTHLGRVTAALGTPYPSRFPGLTALFPTATQLADGLVGPGPGRTAVLPDRAARAVLAVARDLAAGDLVVDVGADAESLRRSLGERPELGGSTAVHVALRVLGDPDCWPAGDPGLVAGARAVGVLGPGPVTVAAHRRLAGLAAAWAPWRSYAAVHLWNAAELAPGPPLETLLEPLLEPLPKPVEEDIR